MTALVRIIRARLGSAEREALKAERRRVSVAQRIIEQAQQRAEATLARYEAGGISLTALGAEMGVSCERVRQIIAKARQRQAARQT